MFAGAAEPLLSDKPFVLLLPVFNDWTAVKKLLTLLDAMVKRHSLRARVLVIDDGSTISAEEGLAGRSFQAFECVEVLRLRRNLGHQRALAIGFAYIEENMPCEAVIVMDGDGEDDFLDVPRLLRKYGEEGGQKIIFAERTKRSESWIFQLFYLLFKLLHYLLTSRRIRVGNFSVIPAARLASLVVVSEIWNHYAAAVYKSRQPVALVPTERSERLGGKSTMNFTNLVIHGLSAISVYADTIGVRLLMVSSVLVLLTLLGLAGIMGLALWNDLDIPSWTMFAAGTLLILLFQAILFSFLFSFIILGDRQGATFLPLRDYRYFVESVKRVDPKP